MRELDNCICAEWDGKGWSTCGVPCPEHITAKSLRKVIANVREYLIKEPGNHPIGKALYQLEQTRLPALEATLERLEAKQ
jgi:hypothetical protein